MIKFILSSLLILGLISTVLAMAQEARVSETGQIQGDEPPAAASPSPPPITAPARPAAQTSPGTGSTTEPVLTTAPGPVVNETPPTPPPAVSRDESGVFVIVGEPDPPSDAKSALGEDELYDLFAIPEEVVLSPEGLPPTTSVPAGPGEARVEKTGVIQEPVASQGAKPEAARGLLTPAKVSKQKPKAAKTSKSETKATAAKTSGQPGQAAEANDGQARPADMNTRAGGAVRPGDSFYQQWALAHKAWLRVGASGLARPASLASDRPLYPLTQSGLAKSSGSL